MASLKKNIKKILGGRINDHEPDKVLIFIVAGIVVFGLVMLSSATSAYAYVKYGDSYYFLKHQIIGLVLGVIAFWIFSKIDYHKWREYGFSMLIFSVVLLLLVFIPGLSAHYGKARSWINIFGFSLQPSEFVKISFLIYMAAWLETKSKKLKEFSQGTGPFVVVLGFIGFLMILQPDIGTLAIISITSLIVYFVGGGNAKHVLTIIIIGILGLMFMVKIMPYQANRFKCFFDPSYSANDVCYQVNQSLIAVGSGGVLGRGLGASRQKYMYLPEVSGDSIFAIVGEEVGFVFSGTLVLVFIVLFFRGVMIAKRAPDNFGKILATGISTWLVIQAIVNIGGVVNFMPMTGVPLPFISYGGSAMMASLAAVGILVNISKQTKTYN